MSATPRFSTAPPPPRLRAAKRERAPRALLQLRCAAARLLGSSVPPSAFAVRWSTLSTMAVHRCCKSRGLRRGPERGRCATHACCLGLGPWCGSDTIRRSWRGSGNQLWNRPGSSGAGSSRHLTALPDQGALAALRDPRCRLGLRAGGCGDRGRGAHAGLAPISRRGAPLLVVPGRRWARGVCARGGWGWGAAARAM